MGHIWWDYPTFAQTTQSRIGWYTNPTVRDVNTTSLANTVANT